MSLLSKKRITYQVHSICTVRSQICENVDKNGAIWCNLGVPKYVITKLKIMILRLINQQQQKFIAIVFPAVNLDEHVI